MLKSQEKISANDTKDLEFPLSKLRVENTIFLTSEDILQAGSVGISGRRNRCKTERFFNIFIPPPPYFVCKCNLKKLEECTAGSIMKVVNLQVYLIANDFLKTFLNLFLV